MSTSKIFIKSSNKSNKEFVQDAVENLCFATEKMGSFMAVLIFQIANLKWASNKNCFRLSLPHQKEKEGFTPSFFFLHGERQARGKRGRERGGGRGPRPRRSTTRYFTRLRTRSLVTFMSAAPLSEKTFSKFFRNYCGKFIWASRCLHSRRCSRVSPPRGWLVFAVRKQASSRTQKNSFPKRKLFLVEVTGLVRNGIAIVPRRGDRVSHDLLGISLLRGRLVLCRAQAGVLPYAKKIASLNGSYFWLRWRDLNPRPLGP